jgi:hypothetical protein
MRTHRDTRRERLGRRARTRRAASAVRALGRLRGAQLPGARRRRAARRRRQIPLGGGRRGRRGVRSRAQLPRLAADGRIERDYTFVVAWGMGAALLGEQEGSVGDDRLDACLRVDASVSPTSCRCPHRTKCWSLAGRGHAPAIRLEARAWSETTPGHDLSARGNVAKVDNSGWSLYGAQRSQPVATGSKRDGAENGSLKRKPLPSVATSCPSRSMVRRGSTVRVRQRALQKPCKSGLCLEVELQELQRALGMEPFMELSDRRRAPHCRETGAERTPCAGRSRAA